MILSSDEKRALFKFAQNRMGLPDIHHHSFYSKLKNANAKLMAKRRAIVDAWEKEQRLNQKK